MLKQNTNFSSIVQQWHHLHQHVPVHTVHYHYRHLTMKGLKNRRQKTRHQELKTYESDYQSLLQMRMRRRQLDGNRKKSA